MAHNQTLSKSHTAPRFFGVLWPWIWSDSRSCPSQPAHLSQKKDPEIRKGFSQSSPASHSFYWKDIFFSLPSAGTWNTAFKTQEKDLTGKLRDVSNTAHTLVLPLRPHPSCQKHQAPLLSYVTAAKDVRSQQCTSVSTEIMEKIIRTSLLKKPPPPSPPKQNTHN